MTRTRTLTIFFIVAALLLLLVAWARAEGPTYHLIHKIRVSDNLPSLIRVVSSTGKTVLEAQWREKGTEREPGYELWERLSGFYHRGEADTLLHTWPICVKQERCAEITRGQLEKALGRNVDEKPMQTSTMITIWK